ncbi:MAG: hypothetical protein GX852_02950 [Clostridiales bacterium]|nr:hypothetical protein [Clostridiales bacterium]
MNKISNSEISALCESLAMLIDSGLPEEEAIIKLAEDGANSSAAIIRNKYDVSLSQALRDSEAFPEYMVEMTEIGEGTGRLSNMLLDLADYYERQGMYEDRIASLIIYPSILMFVLSAILLYIAVKVFPVFNGVYENLSGTVTSATAGMITFATVISWILCAMCLVVGILAIVLYVKWKGAMNKEEVIGYFKYTKFTSRIVYELELAGFTTAVSNYFSSGIDLETSMEQAIKLVKYEALKDKLQACMEALENGTDIVNAFRNNEIYSTANSRILIGAYTSGKMNEGWNDIAEAEWDSVSKSLNEVTESVEPVVTLVLAVVIGLLLLSIMLPLIGIMTAIA